MPKDIDSYFSQDYIASRENFLSTVLRRGQSYQSFLHPLEGPKGEELATDTALVGKADAENLIVVISGTHGLEMFAGSGIQTGFLDRLNMELLDNIAILFVHAINPWGAAYQRRQNEDNVDLNRNFLNFSSPLFVNEYYDSLHQIINTADLFVQGVRNPSVEKKIEEYIDTHGDNGFYTALFQGQPQYSDGVGYCGVGPTWSNLLIREICHQHGINRKRVAVIDIHTGLGDYGDGAILNLYSKKSCRYPMLEKLFGQETISVSDDEAMPYKTKGDMMTALESEFDEHAEVISVALEFGTYSTNQLMQLQIDDAWLQTHGNSSSSLSVSIRGNLQEFFFPDCDDWRAKVFFRGEQVLSEVVQAFQS